MHTSRPWLRHTVLIAATLLISIFAFSFLATSPGQVMMNLTGDGGKNYFTYLYHILYEHGLWFRGMNYPYGEHIVYADGQPLLSVPLAALQAQGRIGISTALAVMHLALVLSYALGILYQYRILRHFGVGSVAAYIAAVATILMCPQVLRIPAHFALAYACFLPMLFYFSLRYREKGSYRYLFLIFLLGSIFSFLHPYYVAMSAIWCGFYAFSYFVTQRTNIREKLRHLLPVLVTAIAITAVMKLFMFWSDPVKDRPSFPHGAMAYGAQGPDLLTSALSPFWQLLQQEGLAEPVENSEGFGYPGLTVIVILAGMLFAAIRRRLYRKKKVAVTAEGPRPFPAVWLVLALCALLLGMGVPFVWQMEWLLDYLSVFRQFRTLGRFIWLFYELITVFAVVSLWCYTLLLKAKGKTRQATLLLVLPLLFWCFEASGYITMIRQQAAAGQLTYKAYTDSSRKSWTAFLQENGHQATDFQAMLLLPFVHIGSEKWAVRGFETGIMYIGFKAALELRLPIVDVMMSRSSWSQTARQVRISGGPFADKPLLDSTGSDKPFLVLLYHKDEVINDEWALLLHADLLGTFADCSVFACYPERNRKAETVQRAGVLDLANGMPPGDTLLDSDGGLLRINHLDQSQPGKAFAGTGGLGVISATDTFLMEVSLPDSLPGDRFYELSTWVLVNDYDFRTPYFNISFADANDQELLRKDVLCRQSFDNKGMWLRSSVSFHVPEQCRKLRWRFYNDDHKSYIALDEIVLKPVFSTLISKWPDGTVMVNNHMLRPAAK